MLAGGARMIRFLFQSTPVIANGRIRPDPAEQCDHPRFNPRPLLLTGESMQVASLSRLKQLFQSTPVIANGRIALD